MWVINAIISLHGELYYEYSSCGYIQQYGRVRARVYALRVNERALKHNGTCQDAYIICVHFIARTNFVILSIIASSIFDNYKKVEIQ